MMSTEKKYFDFKSKLVIDGTARPSAIATALFQRDPFPGGNQYQLSITGHRLQKLFCYMQLGEQNNISEELARRCFLTLGGLLSANEPDAGIEYFLNSIDRIENDGDSIKFFGVCSPLVGGLAEDPTNVDNDA